jgi:hypothetical protein
MGAAGGIAKSCPVCRRLIPVQLGADRTEVSIVVPVYNEGDQIARNAATTRSFALQTIKSANVPVDFMRPIRRS